MSNINSLYKVKFICFIMIFVVLFFIQYNIPEFYQTIWIFLLKGDIQSLVLYLKSFGKWAILVSFTLNLFVNIVGFLPTIFISAANGILFGIIPGIILSWISECVGVTISFILIRLFFKDFTETLIQRSVYAKKIDEFSSENGFKIIFFTRMLPYFPSGIITAIAAVSHMRFRDYFFGNLLGKFPAIVIEVVLGYDILNYEQNLFRLTLVSVSLIGIYIFLLKYKNV